MGYGLWVMGYELQVTKTLQQAEPLIHLPIRIFVTRNFALSGSYELLNYDLANKVSRIISLTVGCGNTIFWNSSTV